MSPALKVPRKTLENWQTGDIRLKSAKPLICIFLNEICIFSK